MNTQLRILLLVIVIVQRFLNCIFSSEKLSSRQSRFVSGSNTFGSRIICKNVVFKQN